MKKAFDNKKYIKLQSDKILERVSQFDDKLYIEFGGKIFDDYHASRVLPGFEIDSKVKALASIKKKVEVIINISADDIQTGKTRNDIGLTYEDDVLRLIDEFENHKIVCKSVVITKYANQPLATIFYQKLKNLGINAYLHYPIDGYPHNTDHVLSEKGFGKNEYVETTHPIIVVTGPGPGSGKMATCLSQLYHDSLKGIKAGYAKYETFPVWNLPLKHPVNLAYEAATSDLNDVNMLDYYHLDKYGISAVNYNRDLDVFPVLNKIFERIYGESPYSSPTDMGVNMIGFCMDDEDVCCDAARDEIIRRYYDALCNLAKKGNNENEVNKIALILKQAKLTTDYRKTTTAAHDRKNANGVACSAIELKDGTIITARTSSLLGPSAALILNATKYLAGIPHNVQLIPQEMIAPIQMTKVNLLHGRNPRLHTDEVLIALSATAANNEQAALALAQLPKLRGCQAHTSVMLSTVDIKLFKRLDVQLTSEAKYENKRIYH